MTTHLANEAGGKPPVTSVNSLFASFPELRNSLPVFPLTILPTPVEHFPALGAAVGFGSLWIKRDDKSGTIYGGNKPRKLEFIIGRARQLGIRRIITFGGLGTNHGLATALAARAAGIDLTLILVKQPVTEAVQVALRRFAALGAELIYGGSPLRTAALALITSLRHTAKSGQRPMILPAGGSNRIGTVGQIAAALELAKQVREGKLPCPSAIFAATGSGGTIAGLAAGVKLAGLPCRVIGIRVSDIMAPTQASLCRLANRTLALLRRKSPRIPPLDLRPQEIAIVKTALGRGYGHPTTAGSQMIDLARREGNLTLDPVYTAKAFAGMVSEADREGFRDKPILFWLTYSSIDPARFIGKLPPASALPAAFQPFLVGLK